MPFVKVNDIQVYYELSGWDDCGQPRFGKLVELNRAFITSHMRSIGLKSGE